MRSQARQQWCYNGAKRRGHKPRVAGVCAGRACTRKRCTSQTVSPSRRDMSWRWCDVRCACSTRVAVFRIDMQHLRPVGLALRQTRNVLNALHLVFSTIHFITLGMYARERAAGSAERSLASRARNVHVEHVKHRASQL